MIIDDAEDMHITFYCKSDSGETRGRGDMQIIYVNSKINFRININKNRGK